MGSGCKVSVRRWTGIDCSKNDPGVISQGGVGQESGELICACGRKPGENVFEPCPGIDAELMASGREAGKYCQATSAVIAAEEEPVLSVMRSSA